MVLVAQQGYTEAELCCINFNFMAFPYGHILDFLIALTDRSGSAASSFELGIVATILDRVAPQIVTDIAVVTVSIVGVNYTWQVDHMVNHHIVMTSQNTMKAIHNKVAELAVVTAV